MNLSAAAAKTTFVKDFSAAQPAFLAKNTERLIECGHSCCKIGHIF